MGLRLGVGGGGSNEIIYSSQSRKKETMDQLGLESRRASFTLIILS